MLGTWELARQKLPFGQALASLSPESLCPACGCHGNWVRWYMGIPSTNLAGFLTVGNKCHHIYEDFSGQKEETTVSKNDSPPGLREPWLSGAHLLL